MSNYTEIGKIIDTALKKALEEGLTLWVVEEETGKSVKLYDLSNSTKHLEDAIFKREQLAIKPIYDEKLNKHHCPKCNAKVNRNYCSNCGQKIDWNWV